MTRLKNMAAYDERALAEVEGEVQPWFFDLEDVSHDPAAGEVLVPFRRWAHDQARRLTRFKREATWYRWFLRVEHVRSFTIEDNAEMGLADFNTVIYDAGERVLTIDCTIPVTMRFEVERLAVHLQETDEVLGLARYRMWGSVTSYNGRVYPLNG